MFTKAIRAPGCVLSHECVASRASLALFQSRTFNIMNKPRYISTSPNLTGAKFILEGSGGCSCFFQSRAFSKPHANEIHEPLVTKISFLNKNFSTRYNTTTTTTITQWNPTKVGSGEGRIFEVTMTR